jgi:predicted DCC family thiol-disulfide oxidoreductase YuxK
MPLFSPIAPTVGMPDTAVDRTALYAGETVLRLTSVNSAREAVGGLAPEVNNGDMSGVLFFDGKCGFCTRSENVLLRFNRTGELKTEPLQGTGAAERLGISPSQLLESVRWLDSSGEVYSGAEAANAALSAALGTRLPLLVYRLPGIRSLQDVVYRWIAANRYRLPGTTPYCESHPVAC